LEWAELAVSSASEEEWLEKIFKPVIVDGLAYPYDTYRSHYRANPIKALENYYRIHGVRASLKSINLSMDVRWEWFRDVSLQPIAEAIASRMQSKYTSGLHLEAAVEALQAKRSALMESLGKLPFYCRDPVLVTS
jgi:hypothetical protein